MTTRSNKWNKIAGYLANEMNEKQEQEFLLEMQDNQLLKNDYEMMKYRWDQFEANPDDKYKDTGKAWDSLHKRIQADSILLQEPMQKRIPGRQSLLRVAAIIVLAIAVGVPTIYFSIQNFPRTSMLEHISTDGILSVDLPDGSQVFLNEGATLNYKQSFEENREVNLKGEGYFNVKPNPNRPFNVNAGKVIVTVLGTSFNVRESESEKNVEIFVESGKVKVSLNDVSESIILEPGQLGRATNILTTSELNNENYLSWKTKDFKFVDESIDEILNVLKQSYHVEVKTDDVSIQDMRLTTSYYNQPFESILSTICLALNIDYEKEGKVYILHSK